MNKIEERIETLEAFNDIVEMLKDKIEWYDDENEMCRRSRESRAVKRKVYNDVINLIEDIATTD